MKPSRVLIAAACTAVLCAAPFGCSKTDPVKDRVPASGKILKADGGPLFAGRVELVPQNDLKKYPFIPFAITAPDGSFQAVMGGNDQGIPPGKYWVTVKMMDPSKKALVPERYHDPLTTPWVVTVPRKGMTDMVLQLEAN